MMLKNKKAFALAGFALAAVASGASAADSSDRNLRGAPAAVAAAPTDAEQRRDLKGDVSDEKCKTKRRYDPEYQKIEACAEPGECASYCEPVKGGKGGEFCVEVCNPSDDDDDDNNKRTQKEMEQEEEKDRDLKSVVDKGEKCKTKRRYSPEYQKIEVCAKPGVCSEHCEPVLGGDGGGDFCVSVCNYN